MNPITSRISATLLAAPGLAAQTQPQTTPTLSSFLSLTPAQTQVISGNNAEYNLIARAKQDRLAQVQSEIVQETARPNLGVNALGERYVELETICRELTGAAKSQRDKNVALLNDQQKVRLAALEEAYRLAVVVRTAQVSLLLPPAQSMNPPIAAQTSFDEQGVSGVFEFPATFPMCRVGGTSLVAGQLAVGLANRQTAPSSQ